MVRQTLRWAAAATMLVTVAATTATDGQFAMQVIDYEPGIGAAPGYTDPATVLGPPERFTGEGVFPGVVSMFNPPWMTDELVSIGEGGWLIVRFDPPVTDDPANPFGVDLLLFGNAFFVNDGGGINGLLGDGGQVAVSPDGVQWSVVPGVVADGLFPTQGYVDSGPFDEEPGSVPSSFTRPVDPSLTIEDFLGLSYEQAVGLYRGSGGGAGIDLAATEFTAVSFVRIANDSPLGNVEIDALADVAPVVPGDATGDGQVNVDDLLAVIIQWGPAVPTTTADLDGNGQVDVDDLVIVLVNWS